MLSGGRLEGGWVVDMMLDDLSWELAVMDRWRSVVPCVRGRGCLNDRGLVLGFALTSQYGQYFDEASYSQVTYRHALFLCRVQGGGVRMLSSRCIRGQVGGVIKATRRARYPRESTKQIE